MLEDGKELKNLVMDMDRHMRDGGAVRKADNVPPDCYFTWEDFHQIFEFDPVFEPSIKTLSVDLDLGWVTLGPGTYIGLPGERVREYGKTVAYARTLGEHTRDRIMLEAKNGRLPDLRKFSVGHGFNTLKQLPKVLKALGAPLPDEAASALTKKA